MSQAPKKIPGLADLVRMRDELVQGFKDIENLIGHLNEITDEVGFHIDWNHERDLKDKIKKTDVGFWEYLIERAGVCDSMTVQSRKEYLERVRTKAPAFEPKAIAALRENADRIYSEGYAQTLREVHRRFIGCGYNSGDRNFRKKDNLQKIEIQFRISGPVYWYGMMGRFDLRDGGCLEDLLTACYLMEGKPKPNYSNNFYSLAYAAFRDSKDDTVLTPYFTVKAYKNGNQKVTWNLDKRSVLDKINRFGAEGLDALGDALRKRYKPGHFAHGGFDAEVAAENFEGGPDLQFYPTPADLVARMIAWAQLGPGLLCLEPSAGDGSLAEAIAQVVGRDRVHCFEIDKDRSEACREKGLATWHQDFLHLKRTSVPDSGFDRIVMNPPFHAQADAIHVLHALRFLRAGGGLVAVMGAGIESSQTRLAKALREAVSLRRGHFEPNPAGSFKVSGTLVRTVTLVIPPNQMETAE